MSRPIKVLLFSTLYPSEVRPGHGIFVETRLRELLSEGGIEAKVVAPVPWFPSKNPRWGSYARMAETPGFEHRHGIVVHHPRYAVIPKFGMYLAPGLLVAGSLSRMKAIIRDGFDFDVIDAHYFYPDGVAAAWIAKKLNKPLTITARGSDLNLIGQFGGTRRMMQWASRQAGACIGVCNALVDVLRSWQVDESRLRVIRNGVDLKQFAVGDRVAMRNQLGLGSGPILLSVGNLLELKGHHLAIDAMATILTTHPDARLVIVGEGPDRSSLESRVEAAGLQRHVMLAGSRPHSELPNWYGAADVLVLASSREGWANVLLEALACGTPVVATRVGGTPEVIQDDSVGRLIETRDAATIADTVLSLLGSLPSREAVRAYAEQFSWAKTNLAQQQIFADLVQRRKYSNA